MASIDNDDQPIVQASKRQESTSSSGSISSSIQNNDEDIPLDTTSTSSIQETTTDSYPSERHFRRRKRCPSLMRDSLTRDELQEQPTTNKIEINSTNIDQEQQKEQTVIEEHETVLLPNFVPVNEQLTTTENESTGKIDTVSLLRSSRLRSRFYHHGSHSSPTQENNISPVEFFLLTDVINIESPSTIIVPSFESTTNHAPCSPSIIRGGLRRTNSSMTNKKMVRFADSVGRELEQVQYIRKSSIDESNLFSTSPFKDHHYIPNSSRLEHKPWSFDVVLTQKQQQLYESILPRRFFCLYRQPNSEHPDVYLHEIWKSQIKLEYADIRIKSCETNEQHLIGTLWVTNPNYRKYVSIKYTFDRWINIYDREAQHRCHSNDFRNLDQYEFTIDIPKDVDRIDFILRYCVNQQEHWDNNNGNNYTLQTKSAYRSQISISLPHDFDFNEMRFY